MSEPNPPRGTTIPAVSDALLAGLDTLDPTVPVLDGLPAQWPKSDAVAVGVSVPGRPGIERHVEFDQRTQGYRESYDITMAIWSWGGADSTMKSVRDRAWLLYDLIDAWLRDNRSLGDLVLHVKMGSSDAAVPRNRGDGAEYTIGFTVHVSAGI